MYVTSPTVVSDFHRLGHSKCRVNMYFGGRTHSNPRLLLWKQTYDVVSVSKSVAWYQNYMHIKACLSTGHIHTAWRQVKMTFIPVPGKVNYTQDKAYCDISLLSYMQKMMEKLVTKNINEKTSGHVRYIYNNLPTKQGSPQKSQCIMWLHTYRKQWKTGSHTWAFLDIQAASDSTSCDITKAWAWRHILAMDWPHLGWQENHSHT